MVARRATVRNSELLPIPPTADVHDVDGITGEQLVEPRQFTLTPEERSRSRSLTRSPSVDMRRLY